MTGVDRSRLLGHLHEAMVADVADRIRDDVRIKIADDDVLQTAEAICKHVGFGPDKLRRVVQEEGFPARQLGTRWKSSKYAIAKWFAGSEEGS